MYKKSIKIKLFYNAIQEYNKTKSLNLALKIQNRYSKIILQNLPKWNHFSLPENFLIGGIDLTFVKDLAIGGIVLLNEKLEIIDKKYKITRVRFPYISGFLSFRELDCILSLIKEIHKPLDLLCFDGHGVLHPRFFGIASHGGLLFDIPSIGIAKKKLVGNYDKKELNQNRKALVYYKNKALGWTILTSGKNPIFVSSGWKVGLTVLPQIIKRISKYRIPEPTRLAHLYIKEIRKNINVNEVF